MITETITTTLLSPPPFKHAEIKSLLTERIKKLHPSFRFLTSTTGVYHFQRVKEFGDYDLKEAIHFAFLLSDYSMHVSVSSRLNPVHTLTPAYNHGLINTHVVVPPGTSYQYDETIESITSIIDRAIVDFGDHGIAFLDNRLRALNSSALVRTGLEIIDLWEFDKTMLRNELNVQLRKAHLVVAHLRHPVYKKLKEQLATIPGQPPEHYKEIPRLAFELMELYCKSHIIA